MGLFDRFRAQPKWKHADAAIRLAGVEELALEEQALLATLARQDADARVRRAAVRKVYDPALLKEVGARDEDAEVRDEAGAVLLDLAIGAFEDSTEGESLKALDHLDDSRHLAAVAKSASAEAVSLAALSRLTDVKAIGSVARRADHAATRLEALARVDDAEELFAIALKSEHRDVALAAVERVTDGEHLKVLAARAAQKPVARRARGMVRTFEDAGQAAPVAAVEAAAPAVPAPDWDRDRDKASRGVAEAAAERDWRVIETRLAAAEARWAQIDRDAPAAATPDRADQFAAACKAARQAIARLKQEESERAARVEQAARQHAERVAACERLEALAAVIARRTAGDGGPDAGTVEAEDVVAELDRARQMWTSLDTPLVAPDEIERLDRRFERACNACQREAERRRTLEGRRARLAELVDQAESLAAAATQARSGIPLDSPPTVLDEGRQPGASDRARWSTIRREWADLGGTLSAGETLAARFDTAQATIARREAEAREQEQRRQREALERLRQLADRLEALPGSEALTLKDGERALRDLRAALEGPGPLGGHREIAERLKAIQSALFPRVQELRETDEWARWANVGIQEELCRQAEALREVADATEAARQLRELQQQWKRASVVPRDRARELWDRFRKAGDDVHARAETHFAQEATERAANLAAKAALCQQAEALAESTGWIKTAEAIKQLQIAWKDIGPVSRGQEKAIWERFRAACDRFFTRRREDLSRRKEEWATNLARKEALIAQAGALAETTTDWDRAVAEIKRLQAEWKSVGPVRKSRSEALWQRFRAACDKLFERYQQRDQIQVAASVAVRESICQEIEGLLPPADAVAPETPEHLPERVAALRARWQQAPVLMPRDSLAGFTARFNDALSRVATAFPAAFRGSDLDLDATSRKAEDLCARVESLVPPEAGQQPDESPATILAARLREALASNTIGGVAVADADARWKAVVAAVRDAQAAWAALGPLPAEVAAGLGDRFERACRRVLEHRHRK
jgi:hypothetical protein